MRSQIEADDIRIGTAAWDDLRGEMLRAVAADMGLQDATLRLVPLKLLIYRAGGHFAEHGDIEVLDGEIVPHGALAHAIPDGGRVYAATGNEGASLELQYRHAVLVLWRRNPATLRMLACLRGAADDSRSPSRWRNAMRTRTATT